MGIFSHPLPTSAITVLPCTRSTCSGFTIHKFTTSIIRRPLRLYRLGRHLHPHHLRAHRRLHRECFFITFVGIVPRCHHLYNHRLRGRRRVFILRILGPVFRCHRHPHPRNNPRLWDARNLALGLGSLGLVPRFRDRDPHHQALSGHHPRFLSQRVGLWEHRRQHRENVQDLDILEARNLDQSKGLLDQGRL